MSSAVSDPAIDVEGVLRAAIVRVLEVEPEGLSLATRFGPDLGADSLAMVEILEATEQELARSAGHGFRFDDELAGAWVTLADAVADARARLVA